MSGPKGVRDRRGTSERSDRSDRRRRGAATSPKDGTKGAIRAVGKYILDRKMTLVFLLVLIIMAFAIRSVWYYDAAYTGGPSPLLSGNDPDYHKRTVDHFVETHHFLERDPLLNYPGGGINPNPPAYSTSVALIGHALKPLFGGDLDAAVWFSMEIGAALWAALTVIPVYLFTREMFGRKSAYFAAFIIAVMAGNIERTPLGFSDHDAFFMFFIVTGFFFLLKALRKVKTKTYVERWRRPRDVTLGLTEFARTNRIGLLYASMAGFALATVALSWKGFPYALAIIFVYLLFHLLVNKFRRIDNTAIGLTVLTTVSIMMLVSLPYYMTMNFMNWYEAPAILFAATCLVVAVFLFTRDMPWLLIIPVLLLIIVVALTVVWYLLPDVWVNIFSGAGYFIRTKLYGTIAEAQPPDINRLVFSYGMTTFFLSLIGVFIMIKNLPKGWKNDHIFTTIWALVSVYMAVAAIRFMYNATPVMAILSGWISYEVVRRMDFRRMVRVFRSMKGDLLKAFKYAVKLRHVAGVLFVVFLIGFPNTWHGVDAGIPYENKKEADLKIYNAMPEFMRPSEDLYDPDSNNLWYLGSFGTSFMSDYWAQGMWWLAEQDKWVPEGDRPAFISWWDYGHWCVQVGKHPTAADNFQNGVEFAGNFIAAQGEDEASALMVVRLFQLNKLNAQVREYMRSQLGNTVTEEMLDLFQNPPKYTPLIKQYPERYGLKDKQVNRLNTIFIHGTWLVKKNTTPEQLVNILLWYRAVMGDEFRYFAVDSRLMPTSYQNTGIFYAPITLSDNRVDEYIQIVAIHEGNQITLEQAAQLTLEQRQNLQYQLVWKRQFFESMFYRCFIGYSGYDQGPDFKDKGIPFVTGDLAREVPLPGWNMTHWRVVHRTIHWNPYPQSKVAEHTQDWRAVSHDKALKEWEKNQALGDDDDNKTVIDDAIRTISQGVVFIKYYAGAFVNGTVTTESGEPVPGATVTVHDDYRFLSGFGGPDFVGIPHGTTQTDDQGRYSILAPFGNVTVVASNGGDMDYTNLHEKNLLNVSKLYISDEAAMRQGEYNFTVDMLVPTAYQNGTVYADVEGNRVYDEGEDTLFSNASLTLRGKGGLNRTYNLTTYPDGYFELEDALPGDYQVSVTFNDHTIEDAGTVVLAPNETKEEDIVIGFSRVFGKVVRRDGKDVEGTVVKARDMQTNETVTDEASESGDYEFKDLLPGNYSVELHIPGTRPINESVTLESDDEVELNLTVIPTAFLEGVAYDDRNGNGRADPGEGLGNATVTFHRIYSADELVWHVTANGTGHYNTSLPTGMYSMYVHEYAGEEPDATEHLAGLQTVEVDADEWLQTIDLACGPAFWVNGTLRRRASEENDTLMSAGRTPVTIWNDHGQLNLTANGTIGASDNATGVFGVYLPQGNYSLLAHQTVTDRPLVNLSHVNVSNEDLDLGEIVLENGTLLTGKVYFDANGDGGVVDAETIPGIELVVEASGHRLNATTDRNGVYELAVAPLRYDVHINASGYEPFLNFTDATPDVEENETVVPKEEPKNFPLRPYNVSYTGLVGYDRDDDGNLSGDGMPDLLVTFEAQVENPDYEPIARTVNATTDAEGRYHVSLAPGSYRMQVKEDLEEELGTFRYRLDQSLEVTPSTELGDEAVTYNGWLDRLVRVNGTVRTDEGDHEVNTNIRVDQTDRRLNIRDNEFEGHVPVGEHLLTATHYEFPGNGTTLRFELEFKKDFDRPTTLNLTFRRVVRFQGQVYYDRNGNGQYDAGDPNDTTKAEEAIEGIPRLVLRGVQDHDVSILVKGAFDDEVFPHDNYTIFIQRRVTDPEDGFEYQYYYNETLDLTEDTEMDIAVSRRTEISGRAYWDIDKNNESSDAEGIEDVAVSIAARDGPASYETTTDGTGRWRQFVLVDTSGEGEYTITAEHPGFSPNETEWELDVGPGNRTLDLPMTPMNVTLNGTTFLDLNENDRLNRYERPIKVDHIQLWNSTNASQTYNASSDANGTFQVTVPPGEYNLLAWSELEGGHIVRLDVLVVMATDANQSIELALRPGRRVSGLMYFYNHTGANHTVPEVNLTFTPIDGDGQVPVLPAEGGSFWAVLPEGRYRVNGTYTNEEFGVDMSYDADEQFRLVLRDRADMDLNFSKVEVRELELSWDDDVPVFLDEGASHNYTVYVRNTGSVNATFDIAAEVPSDWLWESEVDNVSLNISQRTTFWLLINASNQTEAKVHTSKVRATPREGDDEASELDLDITINQHYGFDIRPPGVGEPRGFYVYDPTRDEHHLSYNFVLENEGNGKEVINITVSQVLDWKIDAPPEDIKLSPYGIETNIPIEVTVPSRQELKSQTLKITARALNDPDREVKTLDLELTFPDLRIKKGSVSGNIGDEALEWPRDAPGAGPLAAVAALAVATLVARSRRGWRR